MVSIEKRLAKHVSDLAVLFIKLHDYHWHVRGPQFKVLHELTEALYDGVNEQYDAIAERLVQLGGKAPASAAVYARESSISEAGAAFYTADDILSGVIKDFEYLLGEYKVTRKLAADIDDAATDTLFADYIKDLEKQIWMLKAMKA
ncbi:Dps family protein [Gracilinema caldarium]|uniref:Ferritin Dps family protein n=1 Tax=Gracilinema caldarium (strain ATCC 51460 / DSM 7334 / H1) TaxID=744872 RepID=F8EXB3_GRAC1|nr:DNA starvation/stationary phase protection protein [Gracilinema caldarium]AEJ18856.1 Ferritin Dps family protein [Gracilinema caldarium DSM 7334]